MPGWTLWDADTFGREDSFDIGSTEYGNRPWVDASDQSGHSRIANERLGNANSGSTTMTMRTRLFDVPSKEQDLRFDLQHSTPSNVAGARFWMRFNTSNHGFQMRKNPDGSLTLHRQNASGVTQIASGSVSQDNTSYRARLTDDNDANTTRVEFWAHDMDTPMFDFTDGPLYNVDNDGFQFFAQTQGAGRFVYFDNFELWVKNQ